MNKRVLILLVAVLFLFTSMPVMAAGSPVIYKDTITVTEAGGSFRVGFANIEFERNFLGRGMKPVTFDIEIYAEKGVAYIEFSPDKENFVKEVRISTKGYNGLLYDKAKHKNIKVSIRKKHFSVDHFSRYAF